VTGPDTASVPPRDSRRHRGRCARPGPGGL